MSHGLAVNMGTRIRCPSFRLLCRSRECLQRHKPLAVKKQVDCLTVIIGVRSSTYIENIMNAKAGSVKVVNRTVM